LYIEFISYITDDIRATTNGACLSAPDYISSRLYEFTYCGWFKRGSIHHVPFASWATSLHYNNFMIHNMESNMEGPFQVFLGSEVWSSDFSIDDDNWHHLCFIRTSSSAGTWEIYEDSVLVSSTEGIGVGGYIDTGGSFCNLAEQDSINGGFHDDEVYSGMTGMQYFYGYALTAEQVNGLYDGTSIPDDWVFNFQDLLDGSDGEDHYSSADANFPLTKFTHVHTGK